MEPLPLSLSADIRSRPSERELSSPLEGYRAASGGFDEVRDEQGRIRPAWSEVSRKLAELGMDDFRRRTETLNRIVQENGVTYNAYGDSATSRRPWVMDPLPMIVPHAEWSAIERGVSQRVRLINSVLADLYGPQKLVRSGQIPHGLVHGNPNFLRPLHGFQPPGGIFVHIYAADLARSHDGSWRIIADRLDVPSGIGYALENRFVTQQVMADVFRAADPVRLKPFFQRMLESFETLVQRRTEEPCIVMLSPGPSFETYFEQAFFARNLGYPLVEGADLTTRDNKVFMKTVAGLRQVDVIIRNIPGGESDPLELESSSRLGVPGLVEAARAGNVVMANSLGTGVAESPAMPAFFGPLCRHLLGEELLLPSAETLWCGNPQSFARVMDNLAGYVIKPVFRVRSGEAIFGPLLTHGELEKLRRMMLAEPAMFAAQDLVNDSTIPALSADGSLAPRHSVMRVFLVAGKNGYEMMPGALTRVTEDCDSFSVSMADGGSSKDTWMLAPPEVPQQDHALPHTGPVKIRRSTAELTSREADNLFWMGRYMERVDYQTRLLRVLVGETRECPGPLLPTHIVPFVNTALGLPPESREARETRNMELSRAEGVLDELVWDRANPGGIVSSILFLHATSSAVKERLSLDAVNIINQLSATALGDEADERGRPPLRRLNNFGMLLAGVSGSMGENMTRALDWRFLDLGRRIERALNIVELLTQVFSGEGPVSGTMLSSLLVCGDSRYTYASRYLTNMQPEPVADLLLVDPTNPRSVAFQTAIISAHVAALPISETEEPQTRRRRLALSIDSEIELADIRALLAPDKTGRTPQLSALLTRLSTNIFALSDQIALHYFSHSDKKVLFSRFY